MPSAASVCAMARPMPRLAPETIATFPASFKSIRGFYPGRALSSRLLFADEAFCMVDVVVSGDRAVFTVEGLHKLWSLKSRIEIPLSHITGVEVNHDQVGRWWHGFKLLGSDAPGLF